MALRRLARWLSLASMCSLGVLATTGCVAERDDSADAEDSITEVDQTDVKRQSIGNCWIYATTSWLEALHKGATNEEANISESWMTYWHWYEKIVDKRTITEVSTGGRFSTAVDLIERYGLMKEGDFLPSEADAEMSARQKSALTKVNASLKSGKLSDFAVRKDHVAVRRELDLAWGLSPEQSARMNAVFGPGGDRKLTSPQADAAAPANKIIRPRDFTARLVNAQTHAAVNGNLADAMGKGGGGFLGARSGKYAFQTVSYPSNPASRRNFWKRVQRALHDQVPVVMSWKVDFNALTRDSRFSLDELKRRGSGNQGGHMTLMHDYQAEVPGLGVLQAGKQATPDQMQKALADGTKIQFIRVKNSWGGIRPDRWDDAVLPGYHDLEMTYLDGPIKDCELNEKGETDTKKCFTDVVPLWDATLPAGY